MQSIASRDTRGRVEDPSARAGRDQATAPERRLVENPTLAELRHRCAGTGERAWASCTTAASSPSGVSVVTGLQACTAARVSCVHV